MSRRNFKSWSQESMEAALRRIQLGELSLRAAARIYDLPRSTLQDKVHGRTPVESKQGRSPVLTTEEEQKLVKWIIDMARVGLCQDKKNVLDVVQKFLKKSKRDNPFKDNRPGQAWWQAFMSRHPNLSLRKPQPIGKERSVVTKARVERWFDELEEYLIEKNARSVMTEANRVYNADESGFALGGRVGYRVLAEKGQKVVHELKNSDKTQITVMAAVSATGEFLPPMIVLPGQRAGRDGNPMAGAPAGAFFARTKSGWIDSAAFFGYIANVFHPFLVQRRVPMPVILFVDGHASHQSPEVSEFCNKNGIILYRLPPHATHILQPCDVSVFRALKSAWCDAERQYRFDNPGDFVTKTTFASVFRMAWESVSKRTEIPRNGFRAAGIHPFSKIFNTAHVLPSSIYHFEPPTTPACEDDPSVSSTCSSSDIRPPSPHSSGQHTDGPSMETPQEIPFIPPSIDEYISFPRVEVRRKRKREQLPEVISGEEFLRLVKEKKQKKEEEDRRKQRRKEEREEKRRQKEQQAKEKEEGKRKGKIGGKRKSKSRKNADSECPNCTSDPLDHVDWVRCDECGRWWHQACTYLRNLSLDEVKDMPFTCCNEP